MTVYYLFDYNSICWRHEISCPKAGLWSSLCYYTMSNCIMLGFKIKVADIWWIFCEALNRGRLLVNCLEILNRLELKVPGIFIKNPLFSVKDAI